MELEYWFTDIDESDSLVCIQVRDSGMLPEYTTGTKLEDATRRFYGIKMKENACRALLACAGRELAATAILYLYDVLPFNENPDGRVGQVINVQVDETFRRQDIATRTVERSMKEIRGQTKMVCLSSSEQVLGMYEKAEFFPKRGCLVYHSSWWCEKLRNVGQAMAMVKQGD